MTAATIRVPASTWQELGGDGQMHPVHDPAKIPASLLVHEQVKALQAEVLRLRQKNANRKQALRDLNAAMERKSHHLSVVQIERSVMIDNLEDAYAKIRQLRKS